MNFQISFAVNRNYTTYSFYLNNHTPSPYSSFTFSDQLYFTKLLYLTKIKMSLRVDILRTQSLDLHKYRNECDVQLTLFFTLYLTFICLKTFLS